jgi:hypothetical protein
MMPEKPAAVNSACPNLELEIEAAAGVHGRVHGRPMVVA